MIDTLSAARSDCLERLERAASDRKSPMHIPVVTTADADARMMVLRAFERATWTLRFHTDARAPKIDIIKNDPRVGVLCYDPEDKVQLRMRGTARIEHRSALADAAWDDSDRYARRCYLGAAPGTEVAEPSSGLPDWAEGIKPTEEQLAPVRDHFAVLLVEVAEVDWYALSHDGHRRALLRPSSGHWLTP